MCDFWVYMPSKVLDVSERFVPSETSIREIVRSELHLSASTVNRVDTIRLRKVSIVHSMESKMTNPVPSTVVNPMPSATATQIKVDPSTEKLINVKDQGRALANLERCQKTFVWSSDLPCALQQFLSSTSKFKTFAEEFAFKISLPTDLKTAISIPNYTFQPARFHWGKTQILRTNSSRFAKSCKRASWLKFTLEKQSLKARARRPSWAEFQSWH